MFTERFRTGSHLKFSFAEHRCTVSIYVGSGWLKAQRVWNLNNFDKIIHLDALNQLNLLNFTTRQKTFMTLFVIYISVQTDICMYGYVV